MRFAKKEALLLYTIKGQKFVVVFRETGKTRERGKHRQVTLPAACLGLAEAWPKWCENSSFNPAECSAGTFILMVKMAGRHLHRASGRTRHCLSLVVTVPEHPVAWVVCMKAAVRSHLRYHPVCFR